MVRRGSGSGSIDVGEVEEADGGRGVAGGALQLQLHLARLRRLPAAAPASIPVSLDEIGQRDGASSNREERGRDWCGL